MGLIIFTTSGRVGAVSVEVRHAEYDEIVVAVDEYVAADVQAA
jgi:hypothetical protein